MQDMEQEKETFAVTLDFDMWKDIKVNEPHPSGIHDFNVEDFLGASIIAKHVKGFMTKPVAMFEGKVLEAHAKRIEPGESLVKFITAEKKKGDIFLFSFKYSPERPRYYPDVDFSSVEDPSDTPHLFGKSGWLVWTAVLPK